MIKKAWGVIKGENLTLEKLAKVIDHSLVAPLITDKEVKEGCEVGRRYCTNSVFVKSYHILEFPQNFRCFPVDVELKGD